MNRVLNSNGGTFGYVEHVAVRVDDDSKNDDSRPRWSYEFLERQQQTLDPLQQAVADNCHLHRNTDLA
eukprot:2293379-Ditylum_brightwellii.AAC.1